MGCRLREARSYADADQNAQNAYGDRYACAGHSHCNTGNA